MSSSAMCELKEVSVWLLSVDNVFITKPVSISSLTDTMRVVTTCMQGLKKSMDRLLLKVHFFTLTLSTRCHFSL